MYIESRDVPTFYKKGRFNMVKFTKKYIVANLKDIYKKSDRTRLFKFYYDLTGLHGESNNYNYNMQIFFERFCTSVKMKGVINWLCDTFCFAEKRKHEFERSFLVFLGKRPHPTISESQRIERTKALMMLRRLYEEPITNYSKIAMFGINHLYFCSPVYGHKDYNKVRTCLLNGHLTIDENGIPYDKQASWCEKVVELSNRIYQKKLDEKRTV